MHASLMTSIAINSKKIIVSFCLCCELFLMECYSICFFRAHRFEIASFHNAVYDSSCLRSSSECMYHFASTECVFVNQSISK